RDEAARRHRLERRRPGTITSTGIPDRRPDHRLHLPRQRSRRPFLKGPPVSTTVTTGRTRPARSHATARPSRQTCGRDTPLKGVSRPQVALPVRGYGWYSPSMPVTTPRRSKRSLTSPVRCWSMRGSTVLNGQLRPSVLVVLAHSEP